MIRTQLEHEVAPRSLREHAFCRLIRIYFRPDTVGREFHFREVSRQRADGLLAHPRQPSFDPAGISFSAYPARISFSAYPARISFSAYPARISFSAYPARISFRDRFRDFARACFLLAEGHEELFRIRRAEFQGAPAEMLAQVLRAAVASGQLAPLPVPARTAAAWIGINLVTMQQRVSTDRSPDASTLSPAEAAGLLTSVLFEGLQPLENEGPVRRRDATCRV